MSDRLIGAIITTRSCSESGLYMKKVIETIYNVRYVASVKQVADKIYIAFDREYREDDMETVIEMFKSLLVSGWRVSAKVEVVHADATHYLGKGLIYSQLRNALLEKVAEFEQPCVDIAKNYVVADVRSHLYKLFGYLQDLHEGKRKQLDF